MTTTHNPACPDPEVVGAFVEGRLGASERRMMMEHLDRCEACRVEVAALSNFAAAPIRERIKPFRWWLAAAASLVTIAGVATFQQVQIAHRNSSPVEAVASASSRLGYRTVEARLSGIDWSVFRGAVRSSAEAPKDTKKMKFDGEAAELIERAEKDASPEAQQAAAQASLLTDDARGAIERLAKLTRDHPDDAHLWNDLAAAHYAAGVHFGAASEYPLAYQAAERALKIDPQSPEALFNRALALEKMGLLPQAREAWSRYLEVDSTSQWAGEARTHLEGLPTKSTRIQLKEWPDLEARAVTGDTSFVARAPENARRWAEQFTMARWAAAWKAGNGTEAERQLAIARAIGNALREKSGEGLLADLVATIDHADAARRARLADAHVLYGGAYAAQRDKDYRTARDGYLRAAELFGDAPAALLARFGAADASNWADDAQTALHDLEALSPSIPAPYKALRAHIAYDRGWAEGKLVHWPKAIENYKTALAIFDKLGERLNAATAQKAIAEGSAFLGRRDDAWNGFAAAMHDASEAGSGTEVPNWLNIAANAENLFGYRESAIALFDLAAAGKDLSSDVRAEVSFRRAILSARNGETRETERYIAEGQRAARQIVDERARENALADLDVAEGIAFKSSDPQRALVSLTRAVGVREESRRVLLPATLYERALALRRLGRADEAMADLESAIDAVESQRRTVAWRDTSSGALDGVDEIYTTLAELQLERGRDRDAFLTADRAAAHAFYGADAAGELRTLDALQQQLDPNSVVVEYLPLPKKLVTFVVGAGTFERRETAIPIEEIARRVHVLDGAMVLRAPDPEVQSAAGQLDAILVAPVRPLLRPGMTIAFVPPPLLATVPFGALFNAATGRWLIEDHPLEVAPSARYHDGLQRRASAGVVVISPSAGDVDLPQTAGEVASLQRLYPRANVIEGRDATAASILDAIRDASLIHYAGHTNSNNESGLVLREGQMLYGTDVAATTLRGAPLVVLAGCRTLRGGARREDLDTSLARAFLLAGARSVVGNLWDVEDTAAAALFTQFHESNARTGDPVAALTDAQRSLLQHRGRHPSDWAFAQIVVREL